MLAPETSALDHFATAVTNLLKTSAIKTKNGAAGLDGLGPGIKFFGKKWKFCALQISTSSSAQTRTALTVALVVENEGAFYMCAKYCRQS